MRLVHAECLEATGSREAASATIKKARERLFAVADKIGDPGYRKSFLENVPENRKTTRACAGVARRRIVKREGKW